LLAEENIQGNLLGVIDLDKAGEAQEATVSSKSALNETFDAADHGYNIMEGFGARDVRHEAGISDDGSFEFVGKASTGDTESVDSDWDGFSQADTAISAEGTEGFQPPKSATSTSSLSSSATTDASSTGTVGTGATTVATATTTGFPDETNTGVKAGVAMTKYTGSYRVTQDNAVISNLEVTGDIIIDAKNVTLSNVKLISNTEWHALRIMDDASGFTLKDSEIDGRGLSDNGVYGHGTFLRNNIHDVENGMTLWGPSSVQDNYIHSLRNGKADPHYDGVQVNGGQDIDFIHNTIINDHDQTAALMLENTFGGLANITVDNNRLVGGGYTVYLDGRKGGGVVDDDSIRITNNQIGGGHWGDFSLYDSKPVLYGNTDLDTLPDTSVVYTGTAGDDTLPLSGKTNAGTETYKGLAGDDLLKGGAGADIIEGGADSDTATYAGSSAVKVSLQGTATGGHATGDKLSGIENLIGSSYADTLQGNSSNNLLKGGAGADRLDGAAGTDVASYSAASAGVTASLANATVNTGDAKGDVYVSIERLTGSSHADKLYGNGGANLLTGGAGNDVLNGGSGNDVLHGGSGADDLVGGAGADIFVFKARADSTVSTSGRDTILDFSGTGGDRLDLSDIDANSTASGNQAFTYLGTAAFTGKAGELRTIKDASDTYVYGDVNGDRKVDFAIHLDDAVSLSKGYFVL
jgi:Ca2+-binding RTX toxin-like protein